MEENYDCLTVGSNVDSDKQNAKGIKARGPVGNRYALSQLHWHNTVRRIAIFNQVGG